MTAKKLFAGSIIFVIALGFAALGNFFYNAGAKELMICSEGNGSHYLPSSWCHSYLKTFHMTPTGVAAFNADGGLNFVLAIPSPQLRQQLFIPCTLSCEGRKNGA